MLISENNDLELASNLPDPLLDWLASSPLKDRIDTVAPLFKVQTFQLGQSILTTPGSAVSQQNGNLNQAIHNSDLFMVCQGQVRLLCQGPNHSRPVTACLLKPGDFFGADFALLTGISLLSYWAVAASDCQIVRLSNETLLNWLNRYPELLDPLKQQVQQYQKLIFFRTLSSFHSHPSKALRRLTDQIQTLVIPAGTILQQFSERHPGQYWLRQGEIVSQSIASPPPETGGSWKTDSVPPAWIAQTDLLVYQVRIDQDKIEGFVDQSDSSTDPRSPKTAAFLGQHSGEYASVGPIARETIYPSVTIDPSATTAPTQGDQSEKTPTVEFPKPLRRRFLDALYRYPFIAQQSSSDCGVACLAMIGSYWGQQLRLSPLRELIGVNRSGASLKNLAKAAEKIGFHARPVRASLNRLVDQAKPWIAHWQGDHYVVVYQIKGDRILIADPALGKQVISRQEFVAKWTNYALLLDPTDQLQAVDDQKSRSLWHFGQLLLPYRPILWQIILISLLVQLFGLFTPLLTQVILDKVVVQKSQDTLLVFALGLVIFSIWQVGLTGVRQYLLDYFSNRLDLTLVSGFVSHALRLPLKFFESRQVGDIITRIQENQKIQLFLVRQAVSTWLDALMAFVYAGLMFYYNWQLALLVLALIPPIVLLTLGATPFLKQLSREVFKETAEQNSLVVEMMTGIATIKAVAVEQEVRWRWEDRLTKMLNVQFRGQKLANGLQVLGGLINALGSALLIWYGATLVIQEHLTVGQFVAFNMLIGSVIGPILAVVNVWDELQEVLISVERLNDVFAAEPEETPGKPLLLLPPLQGEVQFEDVTFNYDVSKDRNILQNISFKTKPGQTIAIVGRSGSGKTTLVKLLQGFYHPTRGRILIDGHDIRHVSPESLRSQLGVVPQEVFLFSGTILENIQLYRSQYILDQVIEAAKLAEAHAFIQDLPLGYNTKVGERGTNLSGGQRQRIAIARALLGDPRVLVLDEATSSLDTESERRFQQNLTHVSRDRTTFIIAHRLSTVQHADHILVLDHGILVEQGTHTELIQLQGLYYHLAQQQLNL